MISGHYLGTCCVMAMAPLDRQTGAIHDLRRSVLVVVLRLGIVQKLLNTDLLLLGLCVLFLLLQEGSIRKARRRGNGESSLDTRSLETSLDPSVDVWKQGRDVNTAEDGNVGPSQQGNVGDAELALAGTHDEIAVLEARLEDTVQALGFAYVALRSVGDLLLGEAEEVVCLALPVRRRVSTVGKQTKGESTKVMNIHGPDASVLPAHPLLSNTVIVRVVGERELVFRVVVLGQIGQDGQALEDGKAVPIVVDDSRNSTIRANRRVPRLLLRVLHDVDSLPGVFLAVGVLELLEEDGGLEAIRGACRMVSMGSDFWGLEVE